MRDYSKQNKLGWEYSAYDFWVKTSGSPAERAKKDVENPKRMLKYCVNYFDTYEVYKDIRHVETGAAVHELLLFRSV